MSDLESLRVELPPLDLWQESAIRFDCRREDLTVIPGEHIISTFGEIEDTKGNAGSPGKLIITCLRLIWLHPRKPHRINVSIGWGTVRMLSIHAATSKLRGHLQALFINATLQATPYEFIFADLSPTPTRLYATVQAVHRSFETSRLYRDIKLRGALIRDGKQLALMPDERLSARFPAVWNIASEQGSIGTLYATTHRLVWHSDATPAFNVAVPYVRVRTLSLRAEPRYGGTVLVLGTLLKGRKFGLGFRIDPLERLKDVHAAVRALALASRNAPDFGVRFSRDGGDPAAVGFERVVAQSDRHIDLLDAHFAGSALVDDGTERVRRRDVLSGYAVASKGEAQPTVFSEDLELAIEALPTGYTIPQLWQI
jgi:Bardet-Biedl syndrome 5 protein